MVRAADFECRPIRGDDLPPRADVRVAIRCSPLPGTAAELEIHGFLDTEAMEDRWSVLNRRERPRLAENETACETGDTGRRTWGFGDIACSIDDGAAVIRWTDRRTRSVTRLTGEDDDLAALFQWWRDDGRPLGRDIDDPRRGSEAVAGQEIDAEPEAVAEGIDARPETTLVPESTPLPEVTVQPGAVTGSTPGSATGDAADGVGEPNVIDRPLAAEQPEPVTVAEPRSDRTTNQRNARRQARRDAGPLVKVPGRPKDLVCGPLTEPIVDLGDRRWTVRRITVRDFPRYERIIIQLRRNGRADEPGSTVIGVDRIPVIPVGQLRRALRSAPRPRNSDVVTLVRMDGVDEAPRINRFRPGGTSFIDEISLVRTRGATTAVVATPSRACYEVRAPIWGPSATGREDTAKIFIDLRERPAAARNR